jgi:exosortase/archaeosortase family protein
VPTDTVRAPTPAADFALRAIAWSLGIFGVLRWPWIEARALLPLVHAQGAIAAGIAGTSSLPVDATLACSGADALALCLGAILAYPVSWRHRLGGAAAGVALILALNTLRIGSLGRAVSSPRLFAVLHLYVWPAVLTMAIATYVFWWMRAGAAPADTQSVAVAGPSRRFVILTVIFVIIFSALSPFYLESAAVLALAGVVARAAAGTLAVLGVTAHAAGNVLSTERGAFAVTQECVSTPLIPVYVAAVCAYARSWRQLVPGLVAALPLFTALGIARLLVVALPGSAGSPLFFVHAFYQLLLAAVVVAIAAVWRHGGRHAAGYAASGALAGVLFAWLLGDPYTSAIAAHQAAGAIADPQGALGLLPSFQVGLYLALSVAALAGVYWKRFLVGLATLGATQAAGLAALHALAASPDFVLQVRDVRAWAIAGPVLIFIGVVHGAPARR